MDSDKLKFAVFVDFDNIEIGVKQTLNKRFDIGAVLEAVKERGEVVSKSAYGNWKQAEGFSREMTDHAVHMVQRNTTPGGDKNGADINLALDALETAFIRSHINAFVIVGGDSDFIALVEKLKQYDKKVFIVGGRAFTSAILQKNCHEFIAYENLVGAQPAPRRAPGREHAPGPSRLETVMPLVRRALKILADREVSPQLGLLKSTLLQLDSTFSERDYGTGSFREFVQKLANAGLVSFRQADRSLLVELKDADAPAAQPPRPPAEAREASPPSAENGEAVSRMQAAFESATTELRWPMYLRNVRQFLKSADPYFDERRCSLSRIHDLVKEGHRAGLFRIERDRQGGLRVHPGARLLGLPREEPEAEAASDAFEPPAEAIPEPVPDEPVEETPAPFVELEAGERPAPPEEVPPEMIAPPEPEESVPIIAAPPPKRSRRGASTGRRTAAKGRSRTARRHTGGD